ncbi:MAG: hypothetical protein IJN79_03555 [Clostridia bacterium]|nr:hypothetical protein [Clostridia bacterium]
MKHFMCKEVYQKNLHPKDGGCSLWKKTIQECKTHLLPSEEGRKDVRISNESSFTQGIAGVNPGERAKRKTLDP